MITALSIALAHQPIELAALPTYRSARTILDTSTSSSDSSDGHYGLRIRVTGQLRPWMSVHIDATQSLLNLWYETEPSMQRYGRLRLTAGPRWDLFQLRARIGVGQEGVVSGGLPRAYRSLSVLEAGGEVALAGPMARLTLGLSVFSWPSEPTGRTFDAELTVPNTTLFGAAVAYDHRVLTGEFTFLNGPIRVHDTNHSISVGVIVRPQVGRSATDQ